MPDDDRELLVESERGEAICCLLLRGSGNVGHSVHNAPGYIPLGRRHFRQLAPYAAIGE
jgi:hypothetical protein